MLVGMAALGVFIPAAGCTAIQKTQASYALSDAVKEYSAAKYQEALADVDRAIRLDPADAYAYSARGGIYVILGQSAKALPDLDEAVRLDPQFPEARVNRCTALANLDRFSDALADCNEAIRLRTDLASAYMARASIAIRTNTSGRAIADLDEAIRLAPDQQRFYVQRCNARRHLKNYVDALTDCEHAVMLGRTPAALNQRALTTRDLGRIADSLSDLDEAVSLSPGNVSFRLQRAELRQWSGDINGAVEGYQYVAGQSAVAPLDYLDRAIALTTLGQFREAVRDLEIFRRETTGDLRSYAASNLAWIYATAPDDTLRDGKRALEWAREAQTLAIGERPGVTEALAVALAETGDYRSAIITQEQAIRQINPNYEFSLQRAKTRLALYQSGLPSRDTPLPQVLATSPENRKTD
jgi:tetratricopeptide (TPR) repeat protein